MKYQRSKTKNTFPISSITTFLKHSYSFVKKTRPLYIILLLFVLSATIYLITNKTGKKAQAVYYPTGCHTALFRDNVNNGTDYLQLYPSCAVQNDLDNRTNSYPPFTPPYYYPHSAPVGDQGRCTPDLTGGGSCWVKKDTTNTCNYYIFKYACSGKNTSCPIDNATPASITTCASDYPGQTYVNIDPSIEGEEKTVQLVIINREYYDSCLKPGHTESGEYCAGTTSTGAPNNVGAFADSLVYYTGDKNQPPTAQVSGSITAILGDTPPSYTATAYDVNDNLSSGSIYVLKSDQSAWPAGDVVSLGGQCEVIHGVNNAWCKLRGVTFSSGTSPQVFSDSFTPPAAGQYYIVVNAIDAANVQCTGNPWFPVPSCPSCTDCGTNDNLLVTVLNPTPTPTPTPVASLGTLHINYDSGSGAVAKGTYGISGKRADQGGSNYYNAITIKQTITGGTPTNHYLSGVAFTGSGASAPTANSDLATLKANVDANSGFIMLYANINNNEPGGPSTPGTCGYKFCSTYYYIYFNGRWEGPYTSAGSFNTSSKIQVDISGNITSPLDFKVYFKQDMGSKKWGTYGYLKDATGTRLTPIVPSP